MLTLTTSRVTSRTCDGVGRREFLAVGGLTLSGLLAARAASGAEQSSRTKSVIVVFLAGGPSHIDMYDLKPDAPAEIRGEFQPVETNVPGVRVCDLMPEHAKIADRWAVVNGVQMIDTHSAWVVMTGFDEKLKRPVFGSVVSKLRGSTVGGMPTYVSLRGENGADPGEPFFLGAANKPFTPGGEGMENLGRPKEITLDRLDDRRGLLSGLDKLRRSVDSLGGEIAGQEAFNRQALDIVTSPKAPSTRGRSRRRPASATAPPSGSSPRVGSSRRACRWSLSRWPAPSARPATGIPMRAPTSGARRTSPPCGKSCRSTTARCAR